VRLIRITLSIVMHGVSFYRVDFMIEIKKQVSHSQLLAELGEGFEFTLHHKEDGTCLAELIKGDKEAFALAIEKHIAKPEIVETPEDKIRSLIKEEAVRTFKEALRSEEVKQEIIAAVEESREAAR
jgi:hypothetical protein